MSHRLQIAAATVIACCALATSADASIGGAVGTISTFAGSPVFGPVGATSIADEGPVAGASVGGVSYAYVATGTEVRRTNLASGETVIVAGNGGSGPASPDGTPATSAVIDATSVAVDGAGDMLIGEGAITDGLQFVPASSGTYYGEAMSAGDAYTIQKIKGLEGVTAETIAIDSRGDIGYGYDGTVSVIPAGSASRILITTQSGNLGGSIEDQSVAFDPEGDIAWIGHAESNVVIARKTGSSTWGEPTEYVDAAGKRALGNPFGEGGPATSAELEKPNALAFTSTGALIIDDEDASRVYFVPKSGGSYFGKAMGEEDIYAIAGDGTPGAINAVPATGTLATADAFPASIPGAAPDGDLLLRGGLSVIDVSDGNDLVSTLAGNNSFGYSGDGEAGAEAQLSDAQWVASDSAGDVAIVDGPDSRIRYIPSSSGTFFGQAMTAGHIYTVAGDGVAGLLTATGGQGNGEPATGSKARFSTFAEQSGIALDGAGDLVISDPAANQVRFVPEQSGTYYGRSMIAGDVYAIDESGLSFPDDVAVNSAGDVFVADASGGGDVQEISSAGTPSSVLSSLGFEPSGIALDAEGDIALSRSGFDGDRIYLDPAADGEYFGQTLTAGAATAIAGTGEAGESGDGAQAQDAKLDEPDGIAFDEFGNLLIAQKGEEIVYHHPTDDAVRLMPASSGSFFGQSMTVGDIYTIAGGPLGGFGGDGGPATSALLNDPVAVAPGQAGDVLIADDDNSRVRVVSGSVPLATTETAGTATETSDTVSGSVNPQGRPVSYVFEYGTTSSYGSSTAGAFVASDHSQHAELATLAGLAAGTTYHYRISATYQQAGVTITVPGADATFTTVSAPVTKATETTLVTTTRTPTEELAPAAAATLACTTADVALINVVQQGSHVIITGAAREILAGQKVSITFDATRKIVAVASVGPDGTFSARAPLPPAKIRETNLARYEASVGAHRSLALKLTRRMYMTKAARSGTHVTLAGYVTGRFRAGALVKILLRVTCSKEVVLARTKLTRSGRFSITVPAPTGSTSTIAVYRATTSVLKGGVAQTTYTLPTPPSA